MTMTQTAALPRSRPGISWAFVPVALLLSSALGVGSMALVAIADPNFATEPEYYQKAIHWDATQAQAAENQRLDYHFTLPRSIPIDARGRAAVELRLTDHLEQPVHGASVEGDAFANAFSGRVTRVSLSERSPGVYTTEIAAPHLGLWIFRIRVTHAAQHVTADLRTDLVTRGVR